MVHCTDEYASHSSGAIVVVLFGGTRDLLWLSFQIGINFKSPHLNARLSRRWIEHTLRMKKTAQFDSIRFAFWSGKPSFREVRE